MNYVKFVDERTVRYAPLNLKIGDKTILNFRHSPKLMREHGYKPLVESDEQRDYSKPFHYEYVECEDKIKEVIVYDPLPDDDPAIDDSGDTFGNSEIPN